MLSTSDIMSISLDFVDLPLVSLSKAYESDTREEVNNFILGYQNCSTDQLHIVITSFKKLSLVLVVPGVYTHTCMTRTNSVAAKAGIFALKLVRTILVTSSRMNLKMANYSVLAPLAAKKVIANLNTYGALTGKIEN